MSTDAKIITLPAQRTESPADVAAENGRSQHDHRMLELVWCDRNGNRGGKTHGRLPCSCGWPGVPHRPTEISGPFKDAVQFHKDAFQEHVLADAGRNRA